MNRSFTQMTEKVLLKFFSSSDKVIFGSFSKMSGTKILEQAFESNNHKVTVINTYLGQDVELSFDVDKDVIVKDCYIYKSLTVYSSMIAVAYSAKGMIITKSQPDPVFRIGNVIIEGQSQAIEMKGRSRILINLENNPLIRMKSKSNVALRVNEGQLKINLKNDCALVLATIKSPIFTIIYGKVDLDIEADHVSGKEYGQVFSQNEFKLLYS